MLFVAGFVILTVNGSGVFSIISLFELSLPYSLIPFIRISFVPSFKVTFEENNFVDVLNRNDVDCLPST